MTTNRVAVTGLGVKTPAGTDIASFWDTLLAGRSMAAAIEGIDASDLPVRFACEVKGFDPADYLGHKEARRADRVTQLGVGAAADAVADAGELDADPSRCGVVVGTGIGGLRTQEAEERVMFERGPSKVSPLLVPMMMPNATAALVAMRHGWSGPNLCIATACAAGGHAVGEAFRMVRDGSADVMLTGGAESVISPVTIAAFARMGALSTREETPELASRPFDADRDGFVMGEGAAFLVLERWDRAVARGARIHGEVLGYGCNADAFHLTAPAPGGGGAVACMELALEDAGLTPADIGHVNAHGTSTPLNDGAEAEAITKVFGAGGVPVTANKGVTGHLIGAAGAAEAVASLLALAAGVVPPVANHVTTDPDIVVDVVHGEARAHDGRPVISNSFGFGGHNASLVFGAAS
ncbi:MAG: 3-oxoacyl-[acyl-carrier-protein] synthase [Actinomycetota bacterium]|jgi:3-oxoacyl-[acyl-carrier-protein] synthase II